MSDDCVCLSGMTFHAFHGVHDYEKKNGNQFEVNARFYSDLSKAGQTDDLSHTLDYTTAYQIIAEEMNSSSKNLMETLLENMAAKLLEEFPQTKRIELHIKKINPFQNDKCAASEIIRSWLNS